MSWEPIIAVLALLIGQGVNVVVIRAFVRSEVSKLNGTYTRAGECKLRHVETDRRLENVEAAV
jgi:hypothetical protein